MQLNGLRRIRGMQFFASKNHNVLNGRPFQPERLTNRVCLNPLYNATVSKEVPCEVLLDSGAYQDRKIQDRLTNSQALQRQLDFAERNKFAPDLIVSYDRLVDEAVTSQGKNKRRVAQQTGERYVRQTIDAAKFLADSRDDLRGSRLVLSCQGTTLPQYTRCMKEILEFAEPSDVLGLGGFCIVGQKHRYLEQLLNVTSTAIPLAKKAGVSQIHVFGLGWIPALTKMNVMTRLAGLECSYDTSSYELNGIHGSLFNGHKGGMSAVFTKAQKGTVYHPTDVANANILLVQNYWSVVNQLAISKNAVHGAERVWLPSIPGEFPTEIANSAWWKVWKRRKTVSPSLEKPKSV